MPGRSRLPGEAAGEDSGDGVVVCGPGLVARLDRPANPGLTLGPWATGGTRVADGVGSGAAGASSEVAGTPGWTGSPDATAKLCAGCKLMFHFKILSFNLRRDEEKRYGPPASSPGMNITQDHNLGPISWMMGNRCGPSRAPLTGLEQRRPAQNRARRRPATFPGINSVSLSE